jgi:hypothetical protein
MMLPSCMAQACAPSQQRRFNATGKNETISWWTCAIPVQALLIAKARPYQA